mmetsp:Transcript_5166/g.7912  ORF Transcript_5166/g.7912 Transcript_5166/m.7912 type:complete len:235 (-) Transcript_5166:124-828(-)
MSSHVSYFDPMGVHGYHYLFKCLLLGDSSVGKSSIVERYVENKFSSDFITTIGVDFKVQSFSWDDKIVKLQIWDTAGQERFRCIVKNYYRGANGVIIVYDISDPETARGVVKWIKEVEEYTSSNTSIILVGNKTDLVENGLVHDDTVEETRAIIQSILDCYPDISNYECSAKQGCHVEDAFIGLVKRMINTRRSEYDPYGSRLQPKDSTSQGGALRLSSTSIIGSSGIFSSCCS